MADEEAQDCNCPDEGLPAYMGTFADLMALLMCFFVLLLSFSEMDIQKYKQVAGSMDKAFGVQKKVLGSEIPKGTSIIAQEFSAGKPTPTVLNVVEQATTEQEKKNLDFTDALTKSQGDESVGPGQEKIIEKEVEKIIEKMIEEAGKLKDVLSKEIAAGMIEIKTFPDHLVISIQEKGSFKSGQAKIQKEFYTVLKKISKGINEIEGEVIVAGHTDNIPIRTRQFPSNWVLSAARSANVVHYITKWGKVDESRVQIRGLADQKPVSKENTREGRAKNRRVEIIVLANTGQKLDINTTHESVDIEKVQSNSTDNFNEL